MTLLDDKGLVVLEVKGTNVVITLVGCSSEEEAAEVASILHEQIMAGRISIKTAGAKVKDRLDA